MAVNSWDEIEKFRGNIVKGEWPTIPELYEMAVKRWPDHISFSVFEPEKKALRRQLSRLGWEGLEDLISLQEADMKGKGVLEPGQTDPFPTLRALLEQLRREDACLKVKDLDINGHDLMALGYEGPALGRCLERLLELVLDEQLPNTRPALLEAARRGKGEAI